MQKEINSLAEKLREVAIDMGDSPHEDEYELKPYPGLRPFKYKENYLFFGREGKAQEIAKRLQQSHFVAVVGTSGSGKSSVVGAGLLPLLYGGMLYEFGSHWRIAYMRPAETPIRNLAEALVYPIDPETERDENQPKDETRIGITEAVLLRSGVGLLDFINNPVNRFDEDENLLIVVDQFEELFRFKDKFSAEYSEEASAFVKLLLEGTGVLLEKKEDAAKGRVFVVITMRSDFLGDCAQFHDLPEAINEGQYLIPQMTREQLRQTIESPALVGGAMVSPALVNLILNDLESDENQSTDPGDRTVRDQLPVLQHALMRTWDLCSDIWEKTGETNRVIEVEHYKEIGGLTRALSTHADEAFGKLSARQQVIAEKMFKCLTETDNENREIRRPCKIDEICAVAVATKEEIFEIVEVFRREGRTFLMPPPNITLKEDTKIDISHESLIRNWDTLKGWVKKEAEKAWLYRRISEAAYLYFHEYDGDPGSLWSGRALELALEWRDDAGSTIDWAARYQSLNKEEKSELYKLALTNPAEESARRKEITNRYFDEALKFLQDSADAEAKEQEDRDHVLKLKARERFNRMISWAAAGLVLFALAATVAAFLAYQQRQSALKQNALLMEAQNELQTKNKTLTDAQRLLEQQKEALERQKRDLEEIQKELNKKNEKLGKSVEETREEKLRADEQADLARAAEKTAREETAKTSAINSELTENKRILDMTLQGTISSEAEDYEDALKNFSQVATSQPCKDTNDANCKKTTTFNRWWALYNMANANVGLLNFDQSEQKFQEALAVLDGYDGVKTTTGNTFQPQQQYFVKAEYTKPSASDPIITKGKIITLRAFGRFYRTCAVSPEKCFQNYRPSAAPVSEEDEFMEKPLSPEAIKFNTQAAAQDEILLQLDFIKNGASAKDRLYRAKIQSDLGDIYNDLKEFGKAKENYKLSLDYYKTVRKLSLDNLPLMKRLLTVTLNYALKEPEFAKKTLAKAEADKLAADIISDSTALLSEKRSGDEALYHASIGDTYRELSDIYGTEENFYRNTAKEVEELKKRFKADDKFVKILDSIPASIYDKRSIKNAENLSPEQQSIYDRLVANVLLFAQMQEKASGMGEISTSIYYLVRGDKTYLTEMELFTRLAKAYIENDENCKGLQLIPKLEALARHDAPQADLQKPDPALARVRDVPLIKIWQLADFYQESVHDSGKAANYYKIWADTFKAKFPDNSNPTEGGKFVTYYRKAADFYLSRGSFAEARKMLTEYLTYIQVNEEILSKEETGFFKGRTSLKQIELNSLIGQIYEKENNPVEAAKQYEKALVDVQKWKLTYPVLKKPVYTTPTPIPTNSNANANANANRPNSNRISNRAVTPTYTMTDYYASVDSNNEALSYEAFLRVRLADFDLRNNNAEKAFTLRLNEKIRLSPVTDAVKSFDPLIFEGYVAGLRNAASKMASTNAVQAALYFQYALEALDYLKMRQAQYLVQSKYLRIDDEETYGLRNNLTKAFYDDYLNVVENLLIIKGENVELRKKIEQAKVEMANLRPLKDKKLIECTDTTATNHDTAE